MSIATEIKSPMKIILPMAVMTMTMAEEDKSMAIAISETAMEISGKKVMMMGVELETMKIHRGMMFSIDYTRNSVRFIKCEYELL
jgi:hypothetical protein